MLNQKYIPNQEYKNSTEKDEYQLSILIKKKREKKKGVIEYSNDFINCKIIRDKNSK